MSSMTFPFGVAHTREDVVLVEDLPVPADGNLLPIPKAEPIWSFMAFLIAGPGSMAMAFLTCQAVMYMAAYSSATALWVLLAAFSVYLPAVVTAIWLSESRGEWG